MRDIPEMVPFWSLRGSRVFCGERSKPEIVERSNLLDRCRDIWFAAPRKKRGARNDHKGSILLFPLFLITQIAAADQLIIEPDMGRAPIVNAIKEAKQSIDLVMYGFTDNELFNALQQQKSQGRTIKIILEQRPYKTETENNTIFKKLDWNHINWHDAVPPYQLVHQKTLILDDSKAIVMTFNFTHSTFKNERNFALIIDDPQRVKQIEAIFSADWNRVNPSGNLSGILLSPQNSRVQLSALINQAAHSIRIYAQNISDYQIIGALAKAARKGVQVQIITSGKMRDRQAAYLARAGVKVHFSKQFVIHAKVVIVDDQQAVLGSINLTRASFDHNREMSVITQDPMVIRQLIATFRKDWRGNGSQLNSAFISKRQIKHKVVIARSAATKQSRYRGSDLTRVNRFRDIWIASSLRSSQ